MESISQESRGSSQNKRVWSEQEDLKLIEALLDLHNTGKYPAERGFKPEFFNAVERMLSFSLPESGFKADPHIRSRVKILKGHFAIVHDMLHGPNTNGFVYDDITKCVVAKKPVWDAYIQSHKRAAMFKDKPFIYYRELCTIFGKDKATGRHAETHVDAVEELNREAAATPMDFAILQEPTNIGNTYDACSSRRKRKKMEKAVEKTVYEIAKRSTAAMISQMERNAVLISKALQDGEVQDMRTKLNVELKNIVGLSRAERHRALLKISCDRAITTMFFTLEEEEKEEWVRAILD